MAEDLTEELLHTGAGYRLLTGRDEAGAVYYAREYELGENVDRSLLAARVKNLSALSLPGLAPVRSAQVKGSVLRIVQDEITGANLTTLFKWRPAAVTPDNFKKWAFEFCLFLRELEKETDWTPAPIRPDQLMLTPDGHLRVLAAGWEGLLQPSSRDRQAELLDRFREFTSPVLEHLERQGHDVSSLYWVFQHRCACLDELRESLDRGAPFVPSAVDEIKPLDNFEVPEVEEAPGMVQRFFSQSPLHLILQFSLLVALGVGVYQWSQPKPLPVHGVYKLKGSEIELFEPGTDKRLGKLELPREAQTLELLEGPPRLAVAYRDQPGVDILDRSTGLVLDSIKTEGPVTRMVVCGKLLCMNQGGAPGVLVYDGEQQKVTRVLLTSPGVTSMAVTEAGLAVACREQKVLYLFKMPEGELLSQRSLIGNEIEDEDPKEAVSPAPSSF